MQLDVKLPAVHILKHKVHSCPKIDGICEKSAEELDAHVESINDLSDAKTLLKALTKMVVHLHQQSKEHS